MRVPVQDLERRVIGQVDVVEDDRTRSVGRRVEQAVDRRRCRTGEAEQHEVDAEHRGAVAERFDEPRAADARLALEEDDGTLPRGGGGEQPVEVVELGTAP